MKLSAIPNTICVLRIVLVAPFVLSLLSERYVLALVLIVVAGLSDGVDGFLAKAFGWRSRLGSLLDPAADKLLLVSSYVTLSRLGLVPFAVTLVVILRDVMIVGGALAYRRIAGRLEGEPTLLSKFNTACQLLLIVSILVHAEWALPPMSWVVSLGALVVFTSITSGLSYILIWSRRARLEAGSG